MKWILAGILVVLLFVRDMLANGNGHDTDRDEIRYSWNGLSIIALVLIACLASGCAALPMSMQPSDQTSAYAEGTFLALDTIDTLQTVTIAKHPKCWREADPVAAKLYGSDHPSAGKVIGINVLLMVAHTMVASWLDDEVDKHVALDNATPGLDSVGPWYVGRVVFHAVSIVGSGAAVMSNKAKGISPLGGGC